MTCWDCSTVSRPNSSRSMPVFHAEMQRAFGEYIEDVHAKTFPTAEHSIDMAEDEWQALLKDI